MTWRFERSDMLREAAQNLYRSLTADAAINDAGIIELRWCGPLSSVRVAIKYDDRRYWHEEERVTNGTTDVSRLNVVVRRALSVKILMD